MRRLTSIFLLLHFLFYIGCAPALNSRFIFKIENEKTPVNEVDKNIFISIADKRGILVEILSLRSGSMIVASEQSINDFSIIYEDYYLTTINYSEVERIKIQSKSLTKKGFQKGFKIGGIVATLVFALGVLLDDTVNSDGELLGLALLISPLAFLGGGFNGGAIGAGIGAIYSIFDTDIVNGVEFDFNTLRPYARYPKIEPKILRELFPE